MKKSLLMLAKTSTYLYQGFLYQPHIELMLLAKIWKAQPFRNQELDDFSGFLLQALPPCQHLDGRMFFCLVFANQ